jgi:uncharacterized protein (TIGR00266 family)
MQYVEVTLDPGETVIAEAGGMMYMTHGIQMQTMFGDPSQQNQGFLGKVMTAGKRALTGESLFVTTFTASGAGREVVAFAAPYPGKIIPMHLDKLGGELICQKDAFLCAAMGTQVSIAFQKKIGVALFGGEGFIMQRLTGDGIAMVHAGGTIIERDLKPGESLRLDTGCLVAMQPSVHYDIQMVGGIKNALFGGEGLFLATLGGPGKVWMQSLPFSRLAGRVLANAPGGAGRGRDEGSLLGNLGGLLGNSDWPSAFPSRRGRIPYPNRRQSGQWRPIPSNGHFSRCSTEPRPPKAEPTPAHNHPPALHGGPLFPSPCTQGRGSG